MSQLEFMFAHAPASLVILVVTVSVSILAFRSRTVADRLLLYPWKMFRGSQYERIFTYGFIHADFMHLLFNLIALYSVAMYIEAAAGTFRFLVIYLVSMVLAAFPPTLRHRNNEAYRALGASGAVSALFFSGMLYFPTAKVMLLFLPIPLPWPLFAVLFIAGSIVGAKKNWGNIGHDVHLYGAISGLLLTIVLDPSSVTNFLEGVGLQ
ncbi:MAG: rhomboid family intramembrane serine protease [Ignavibacteria bacterium]|nr:MAG: rhomboid family intramembrane serine protease [Ignavibacteria bacterium]